MKTVTTYYPLMYFKSNFRIIQVSFHIRKRYVSRTMNIQWVQETIEQRSSPK